MIVLIALMVIAAVVIAGACWLVNAIADDDVF
jgi:hypothetical protein